MRVLWIFVSSSSKEHGGACNADGHNCRDSDQFDYEQDGNTRLRHHRLLIDGPQDEECDAEEYDGREGCF